MNDRFLWFLRILIVIQSLGYAAKLVGPSALNSFLLGSMGDPFVTNLDRSVQIFIWFSSAALLGLGFLQPPARSLARRLDFLILGLLAGWFFLLAIFSWLVNPGNPFHATDPAGHAVRYAAPLALILFIAFPGREEESKIMWILRWGVAGTFVGHGLCALWMKPSFVDLIVGTMNSFFGDPVLTAGSLEALEEAFAVAASRQAFAEAALPIIAIQDFILVALLLLPGKRIKTVALWMAVWGIVTAMSRMTAYGWDFWHDLALRICNGAIPLFLWAYWKSLDSTKTTS
ncbi:MAG: hypothetical protein HN531_13410 [Opitutae bacterium]|jgi:hypothetical protein|nr:hypothetical protein [Opitutae bacterium]